MAINLIPMGYQQITSMSAAVGLTVPRDVEGVAANYALISPQTQSVRWRDDGVNPTATVGFLMQTGDVLEYDGDLFKIKFIETTASAALNVSFYRKDKP